MSSAHRIATSFSRLVARCAAVRYLKRRDDQSMQWAEGKVEDSERNLLQAKEYATRYYRNEEVMKSFEPLLRHRPAVFNGYMSLRQAAFNTGPGAALSEREKELILVAIEVAIRKKNGPAGHARRAIDAGATVAEVAEVVSLCMMICGMITYVESGRYGIEAAEAASLGRRGQPGQADGGATEQDAR